MSFRIFVRVLDRFGNCLSLVFWRINKLKIRPLDYFMIRTLEGDF